MVVRRIRLGPRRLAQHVVGIGVAPVDHRRPARHRLADVAAQHELRAHFPHRAAHGGTDDRLTQPPHHAAQRTDDAAIVLLVQHPPGQHQPPGRGIDHHRPAIAHMRAPVMRGDLVLDQVVDRLGIRHAQQRLGQRHQGHALLGRQAIFREERFHHPRIARIAHIAHHARRPLGNAVSRIFRQVGEGRQPRHGGGFIGKGRGTNGVSVEGGHGHSSIW